MKVVRDRWFDYIRLMVTCYLLTLIATKQLPAEKKIAMFNALLALWAYREEKKGIVDDAEEETQTESTGLARRTSRGAANGDPK